MRYNLTEISIRALKFEGRQKIFFDSNLPGFGVRVSKTAKSYVVVHGQHRSVKTLGRHPDMPLKQARADARAFLVAKTVEDSTPGTKSLKSASTAYLAQADRRLKRATVQQYAQYLATLPDKPLGELTKADINLALSQYDGKPSAQNYAYAAYRAFLNWCLDQEYIDKHPLLRGKPPNKTRSRSRVLSDDELVRVWRSTEDNAYGRMVRLMILTGQRREEVRRLKPEDVADDLITFHTKGDNLNVLPVTPCVKQNLYLPFRFNNWSNSLAKLQAEARVENFTHHDLRRTFATNLARLGINDIVIERALGHTVENVKHTYNRYSYLPDLRDALLTYENHLARLLTAWA